MRDEMTLEAAIEIGRREMISLAHQHFQEEQKGLGVNDEDWIIGGL